MATLIIFISSNREVSLKITNFVCLFYILKKEIVKLPNYVTKKKTPLVIQHKSGWLKLDCLFIVSSLASFKK